MEAGGFADYPARGPLLTNSHFREPLPSHDSLCTATHVLVPQSCSCPGQRDPGMILPEAGTDKPSRLSTHGQLWTGEHHPVQPPHKQRYEESWW